MDVKRIGANLSDLPIDNDLFHPVETWQIEHRRQQDLFHDGSKAALSRNGFAVHAARVDPEDGPVWCWALDFR